MKNFTFAALFLAAAMSASAQYTVEDPGIDAVLVGLDAESSYVFDCFITNNYTLTQAQAKGYTVNDYRVNDVTSHFWWWNEAAWNAWDNNGYPDVDFSDEPGYIGVVTNAAAVSSGWSGGGIALDAAGNYDFSHMSGDTHFHVAFRSTTLTSAALNIFAEDGVDAPANLSLGSAFDGQPVLAGYGSDDEEWVGVDITLNNLKKLWPAFEIPSSSNWTGNVLAILTGAIEGKNLCLDGVYCYSPVNAGVGSLVADKDNEISVIGNQVIAAGAQSIEVYNLAGQLVQSAASDMLTLDQANGMYIVKAGSQVKKIIR
ncbi:MAG: T9SS type A sorting domain-containing protein [Bacteroidales bacterium]|nr:T9SS type A sorting domain-containing protein [Bacteroidales bacterium]MCD8395158.1 T9SS type A sorting domain-containing protein [Bacteroidales bacterium]